MALPTFPTIEVAFVKQLNGNPYNASSNPYGMDEGGHIILWPPAMNDIGVIGQYVGDAATEVKSMADQVANDAASAAAGSGTEATAANIRSGTSANYLSIRRVYDAATPIEVTVSSGTAEIDMNAGINFKVTGLSTDCLFANPTNIVAGKSGVIDIKMDGTGGRAVTFGSYFVFAGDGAAVSTDPNSRSLIAYYAASATEILCTVAPGFAAS